jgi:dGTPase
MMYWKALLSPLRFGQPLNPESNIEEIRSEFQRDYDRIIFSSPFRRLQNKTQVFPLPGSVFVHNRLTHSLEVASVGRSLGNMVYSGLLPKLDNDERKIVREIDTVVATACLAHDLGNPPFGHSGEKAISYFFTKGEGIDIRNSITEAEYSDLVSFEGNANLLRLLTHQFQGRRAGGYALTFASLGTMIKYPNDSITADARKKKYGFFQSEKHTFNQIMNQLQIPVLDENKEIYARHPLVYLMEAADDICYQVMDLEDANKLKILPVNEVFKLFMEFFQGTGDAMRSKIDRNLIEVTDTNEQIAFLRAMVINRLTSVAARVFCENYEAIMSGWFTGKLLDYAEPEILLVMKKCEKIAKEQVYRHPSVIKIEISGYNVLGSLLREFYMAIMNQEENYSQMILSLMPLQYQTQNTNKYQKARAVVDFISGMTDVYAVDLYKQIQGIEL